MSLSAQFQSALRDVLSTPGVLRAPGLPIVARRTMEPAAEIEAAAAIAGGLCLFVLPPQPRKATYHAPFVFFEEAEFRLRVIETPNANPTGHNAYELLDDIILALHGAPQAAGSPLAPLLAHPMQLAPHPITRMKEPGRRIVDALFTAAYQLPGPLAEPAAFTLTGHSAVEDLQAAVVAQLRSVVDSSVPLLGQLDEDLTAQIAQSGNFLQIEVLPPLPSSALNEVDTPFFHQTEIRVRITECPQANSLDLDAYDLAEIVAQGLHYQPFDGLLAQPLLLAETPMEFREPEAAPADPFAQRQIDVLFEAVFALNPIS